MKIMKSVLKVVFWLLIVALLLAPLGLIYEISVRERAAYEAPSAPVIREGAIGASIEATRQDVDEYVRISGREPLCRLRYAGQLCPYKHHHPR